MLTFDDQAENWHFCSPHVRPRVTCLQNTDVKNGMKTRKGEGRRKRAGTRKKFLANWCPFSPLATRCQGIEAKPTRERKVRLRDRETQEHFRLIKLGEERERIEMRGNEE